MGSTLSHASEVIQEYKLDLSATEGYQIRPDTYP